MPAHRRPLSRRSAARGVVVLACVGGVLATAGVTTSEGTSRRPVHVVAAIHTTASNRRAAVRDARTLLAGVVAPAGATLKSAGTGLGPRVSLLTSAFASAVAYRSWNVPGSPSRVLSFIEGHLPAGSSLVSSGYGGPNPGSESVTRAWPPIAGVLDTRWLEIDVTSRPDGGTRVYAESQSQWIVIRLPGEQIPRGVHEVDVTSGEPGKTAFLSRRVTDPVQIHALVTLFDSLPIVQPGAINCPAELVVPVVVVHFRAGDRVVARASVSSDASFTWPPSAPGWACFAIAFNVRGRSATPLAGNVITPIERLLHVTLTERG